MDIINALGKPCPIPVIEAKKALRNAAAGEKVSLLVDNDISAQNLEKMAQGMGLPCEHVKNDDGNILVTITVTAGSTDRESSKTGGAFSVLIGKQVMGAGNDELGAALLKSFIYALTELDKPPEHMVFFNSGVKLTTEGSNAIADLKTLESKGTVIASCGACLDFYQLKDKLSVGTVTNMYAITALIAESEKVINI
jgi:selenium metabolism protein YedF